jgi:polyisoprenyl-teichoic acid--peptidoglycan teichoic acid transferase
MDDIHATGVHNGRPAGEPRRTSRRSPGGAAFLSFLFPGLGQVYVGRWLRAFLWAAPLLVLAAVAVALIAPAPEMFALRLLMPWFALAIVGLIGLVGAWRALAIIDAWLVARRTGRGRGGSVVALVVLLALVVAGHGVLGYYVHSFAGAGDRMFGGNDSPGGVTDPLDEALGPSGPAQPVPRNEPVNVLFVGVDSGPDRDHALTDTLIVASYDPATNEIVMISVPRDTGRVPLFDGTTYNRRINTLLSHFRSNPDRYPNGGIETLKRQMGHLIGVPIHYYAVTNMAGLREVVDLVGGVDVTLEQAINDPRMPLRMEPGRHHLDGQRALMYVRSRYGPGNSDFVRARRQQQVIRALAEKGRDPNVLVRLPEVLDAGSRVVRSDVPVDQLPEILALLDRSADASTEQIVLSPPRYARRIPREEVGGRYMIELRMDALAELSVELFGPRSRYASR